MPTPEAIAHIKEALESIASRDGETGYKRYADYYHGRQKFAFGSQQIRTKAGELISAFSDNLMRGVVDAVADRMQFEDEPFAVEEGPKEAADTATEIWQRNRMDRRAGEFHQEMGKRGDAYLIVWPDKDGYPRFYTQKAYLCNVVYDEEQPEVVLRGAKAWTTKLWENGKSVKRTRVTLYYPDRIERYVSRSAALVETGGTANANSFVEYDADPNNPPILQHPWGVVPLFHAGNNASPGDFGIPEHIDALHLQDFLNKSVVDMMVAMEFHALPQRYMTGIEGPPSPTGGNQPDPFAEILKRRVWLLESIYGENVKIGQFEAGDMRQFLDVAEHYRTEIARVTRTPVHFFQLISNPPSGESLKTLEAMFTKKIRDRQNTAGNTWENAMALAYRMRTGASEGAVRFAAKWVDPAPVSRKELAETVLSWEKVQTEKGLAEIGFTETEAAEILAQTQPTRDINRDRAALALERDRSAVRPNAERLADVPLQAR